MYGKPAFVVAHTMSSLSCIKVDQRVSSAGIVPIQQLGSNQDTVPFLLLMIHFLFRITLFSLT